MAGLKTKSGRRIRAAMDKHAREIKSGNPDWLVRMKPSEQGMQAAQHLQRLNDQLHAIRRLMEKPELCPAPVMDVVVIALAAVHGKYESAAAEMRGLWRA